MTAPDEPVCASDMMSTHVRTVSQDMHLQDVINYLLDHELSNAPVTEQQQLVGFISERDCLAALSREAFFGNPAPPQTAATVMRRHPVCVSPDTDMFTLASIFVNHGFRHLPVTDDHILLGIVSRRDVLRALNEYYNQVVHDSIRQHSPPDLTKLVNHRFLVSD